MARFKAGDRIRCTDSEHLALQFRYQVGTIIQLTDAEGDIYKVSFDNINPPRATEYWSVIEEVMEPWADVDVSDPQNIEDFLNA